MSAPLPRLLRLWWLDRVPPPNARLVLVLGLGIRAAGILMLAGTIPVIWDHIAHPWWSALVAALLAVENAAVALWWLARRRADARVLWVDLPTGAIAIVVDTALNPGHGVAGWALFVYPNTVLMAFVVGLLCRRAWGAVACGGLWAVSHAVATLVFRDLTAAGLAQSDPAYLINVLIGWGGGSMLRRNERLLAEASAAELRETAELAASAQKWRLATALHDGVLQTLETLQRSPDITDPALRAEVSDRASWLRRYIETGRGDQDGDLGVDLDAVATAARQAGIAVEVNAARLLATDGGPEEAHPALAAPQREAMIEGLFQTIASFGANGDAVIMVRAVPDRGGVHVTVLTTGDDTPSGADVAEASARLASAGGWLKATPVPCIELWAPGPD